MRMLVARMRSRLFRPKLRRRYGLAVEHTLGDLTQWHGERGATYFYQSEMPYDATQVSWP